MHNTRTQCNCTFEAGASNNTSLHCSNTEHAGGMQDSRHSPTRDTRDDRAEEGKVKVLSTLDITLGGEVGWEGTACAGTKNHTHVLL